ALHDEQLAEHGGSPGIRNEGMLDSALGRPENLEAYGDPPPDLADLAAAYAFGLAKNHPFIDGNKRVSMVVTETFIELNGRQLTAMNAEIVATWLALASGEMDEAAMAAWIRARI
ncbi:type II toxin-antitoxin system death-on-curing family toxin, partial [Xanthomonas citri pv. citri]